jgi:hypothetical protein
VPMLGFVYRGLADPEQGKGKKKGNKLKSIENKTCGEAHGKLRSTSIPPG